MLSLPLVSGSLASKEVSLKLVLERDAKKGKVIPIQFKNVEFHKTDPTDREKDDSRRRELEKEWEKTRQLKERELDTRFIQQRETTERVC